MSATYYVKIKRPGELPSAVLDPDTWRTKLLTKEQAFDACDKFYDEGNDPNVEAAYVFEVGEMNPVYQRPD